MAALLAADNSLQRKVVVEVKEKKRSLSDSEETGGEKTGVILQVLDNKGSDFKPVKADEENVKQTTETKTEPETGSVDATVKTLKSEVQEVIVKEADPEPETPVFVKEAVPVRKNSLGPAQEFTVTKPTPLEGSPQTVRASWNKQQKIVNTEVAGNTARGDQPQLMRIKRLDSQQISELESKMGDDDVFAKPAPPPQKRVGFVDEPTEIDKPESYKTIVVGGVVQRIPVERGQGSTSSSESPTVRMRNKPPVSKTKIDRRVSCKDLGQGDCQGWLYKRKQKGRSLARHWDKRWCILKNYSLFCYKHKDDLKAECVVHLPAFQVSPAPEVKTKKCVYSAFKIHNEGTSFYFASERQDDMGKWMNKMGLAAINYDASRDITTSGFVRPGKTSTSSINSYNVNNGYSDSEDEGEDLSQQRWHGSIQSLNSINSVSSTNSPQQSPVVKRHAVKDGSGNSPQHSPGTRRHPMKEVKESVGASTEELHAMYRSIQKNDLTIDGKDKIWQRRSQCTASNALIGVADQSEVERLRKLNSLQRTLRAKELELQQIDSLMNKPLSRDDLHNFAEMHEIVPIPE